MYSSFVLIMEKKIMKKITLTTIKKFIKENKGKIYIKNISHFNGMTDGIDNCENQNFYLSEQTEIKQKQYGRDNTLGLKGAYFVFDTRDYFNTFNENNFKGFTISNCIGHFVIAIKESQ